MFSPIAKFLRERLKEHGILSPTEAAQLSHTLTRYLEREYGGTLQQKVKFYAMKNGVLTVTTSSSTLCHDLSLNQERALAFLKEKHPHLSITQIRCVG